MALQKPLVFDTGRGIPRAIDQGDVLHLPGDIQLDGKVGFYGTPPGAKPSVAGPWGQTIDELIKALAALGLINDARPQGWINSINSLGTVSNVGPYEPGRLIIGSVSGWMQLDQPAAVPGVIQAPVSHAGAVEVNPISGLPMQQLAYSPILSYSATPPPTRALTGSLWYDVPNATLKVYTGTAWQAVEPSALTQLVTAINGAGKGALLVADGSGGISALSAPIGRPGRVLAFDSAQQGHYIDLITVDTVPPWQNGGSYSDPAPRGGARPVGMDQAIWCNTASNAETIGFWDEASHQWKSVYVNNPILNQLAELRTQTADGDLFTVKNNSVVRLPVGKQGESLVVDAGELKWHDRFSASSVAPSGAVDGDLWLDSTTDVVRVHENGRWLDFNEVERYVDVNGTGGAVRPGQPLVHGAPNWRLAGPSTTQGSFIAVALEDALGGVRMAAAVGGVVSLTEAQWSAVIDNAEPRALGTGLSAGRDYYVSSTDPGYLTTKPAGGMGIPVGTAFSSTHLLLRNGAMRSALAPSRAHVGVTPPAGSPGELWWSSKTGQLYVLFDDGTSTQWVSVSTDGVPDQGGAAGGSGAGGGTGTTPGASALAVGDLEAIDWVADPLAAAIRIKYTDGTEGTLRIRGAGGAVVTMSDNHTLVIDAGGGSRAPQTAGGAALPAGAAEGQVLVWRGGVAVWETMQAPAAGPTVIDAGNFTTGAGTPSGGVAAINGGHFTP